VTARYQTDESLALEAAAFELVGTVGALLLNGERLPDGTVRIDLHRDALAHVLDVYNRATHNGPLTLPEP
jgi:hypothetical protein